MSSNFVSVNGHGREWDECCVLREVGLIRCLGMLWIGGQFEKENGLGIDEFGGSSDSSTVGGLMGEHHYRRSVCGFGGMAC